MCIDIASVPAVCLFGLCGNYISLDECIDHPAKLIIGKGVVDDLSDFILPSSYVLRVDSVSNVPHYCSFAQSYIV